MNSFEHINTLRNLLSVMIGGTNYVAGRCMVERNTIAIHMNPPVPVARDEKPFIGDSITTLGHRVRLRAYDKDSATDSVIKPWLHTLVLKLDRGAIVASVTLSESSKEDSKTWSEVASQCECVQ